MWFYFLCFFYYCQTQKLSVSWGTCILKQQDKEQVVIKSNTLESVRGIENDVKSYFRSCKKRTPWQCWVQDCFFWIWLLTIWILLYLWISWLSLPNPLLRWWRRRSILQDKFWWTVIKLIYLREIMYSQVPVPKPNQTVKRST